jgi:hypothetical protein
MYLPEVILQPLDESSLLLGGMRLRNYSDSGPDGHAVAGLTVGWLLV